MLPAHLISCIVLPKGEEPKTRERESKEEEVCTCIRHSKKCDTTQTDVDLTALLCPHPLLHTYIRTYSTSPLLHMQLLYIVHTQHKETPTRALQPLTMTSSPNPMPSPPPLQWQTPVTVSVGASPQSLCSCSTQGQGKRRRRMTRKEMTCSHTTCRRHTKSLLSTDTANDVHT